MECGALHHAKQKKHAIKFPKPVQDKCKDMCHLISCMLDPDSGQTIDINILQHGRLQEISQILPHYDLRHVDSVWTMYCIVRFQLIQLNK